MEKIKNIRNQKGLSQLKMAENLGISQTGYAKIEKGTPDNISLSVAVGIARELNVGFNELFEIVGDSLIVDKLTAENNELKREIDRLKEELNDKRSILDFLSDNDLLFEVAHHIERTIEGFERKPLIRDFNDTDSLIKELDNRPFQREDKKSMIDYILKNSEKLKGFKSNK